MTTAPFGFLRVAAACPPVRIADPERNAEEVTSWVAQAAVRGVQVLVLPELCAHRLHVRRPLLQPRTRWSRAPSGRSRACCARPPATRWSSSSACRCRPAAGCSTRPPCCRRASCSGSCRRRTCQATRSTTRSAGSPPRASAARARCALAGGRRPVRDRPAVPPGRRSPASCSAVEICEDLWAPVPPSCHHAVAGATVILNPSAGNDLVAKADYRRAARRAAVRRARSRPTCTPTPASTSRRPTSSSAAT